MVFFFFSPVFVKNRPSCYRFSLFYSRVWFVTTCLSIVSRLPLPPSKYITTFFHPSRNLKNVIPRSFVWIARRFVHKRPLFLCESSNRLGEVPAHTRCTAFVWPLLCAFSFARMLLIRLVTYVHSGEERSRRCRPHWLQRVCNSELLLAGSASAASRR